MVRVSVGSVDGTVDGGVKVGSSLKFVIGLWASCGSGVGVFKCEG